MAITVTFLNDATRKPAVYFDRPDLNAFTVRITSDSTAPVTVPSVRIRFPTSIIAVDQVKRMAVNTPGWKAAASGPFLTLTAPPGVSLSDAGPLVLALTGVSSTNTAATNDDLLVQVASEAPATKLFLMRFPAEAGDLTKVMAAQLLPAEVSRTPSDYDTVRNVLTLRLINLNPGAPLITAPWVRKPTIRLSFVYGNDIGSLTPADPPVGNPHSAFNITIDPVATYVNGTVTYEWASTQPDSQAVDVTPVWTLQPVPENQAVLGTGSGATAEFRISGLSTSAPAGNTLVYLQFADFPGYSDGYITLPLAKVEPKPAIVYFDGQPNYVAALGDTITLEWQTIAMARVELHAAGQPLQGPLDAAHGTRAVTVDRNTDFALLAFKKTTDTVPAFTAQWTGHVPDARITTFTANVTIVADGSPVALSWATQFARSGEIRSDTTFSIPAASLRSGSKTYYPRRPTTYRLHLEGQNPPPDRAVDVFVLQRDWSVRHMGFSPYAGQGPVLYGTDSGLILVAGQSDNAIFQSADGTLWNQVGIAQFPARNDAAGCAFNGKLWIMGGTVNGKHANDVWSSTDGLTWIRATTAPWPARSLFACTVFSGKLWIFGGQDQNHQPLNDIWSSADGITWTKVADGSARWAARSGPAVTAHAGKLWLFGGTLAGGDLGGDLWSSTNGVTWESHGSGMPWDNDGPARRTRAVLASLGETTPLYLFGGLGPDGAALNDFYQFDGDWNLATGPSGWTIRQPGFTIWKTAFWFAGGTSGNAASDSVWSWFSGRPS